MVMKIRLKDHLKEDQFKRSTVIDVSVVTL